MVYTDGENTDGEKKRPEGAEQASGVARRFLERLGLARIVGAKKRRDELRETLPSDVLQISDEEIEDARKRYGADCALGHVDMNFRENGREEALREEYQRRKSRGEIVAIAGGGDLVGFDLYHIYKEKDPVKWFGEFQGIAEITLEHPELFSRDPETAHYYDQFKDLIKEFAELDNPAVKKRGWLRFLRKNKAMLDGPYGMFNFLLETQRAVKYYRSMENLNEKEHMPDEVFTRIQTDHFQIIVRSRGEEGRKEGDRRFGTFIAQEQRDDKVRVFESETFIPSE